jgi:C4-dicarboxylate-specific signal transduction histidine kinase
VRKTILTVNTIQAMAQVGPTRRTLIIQTTLSYPHTLCCTLEHSGPGIKPEHLDRLFDSFFTTKDAGMGLGHNESAYGGARFSLTLPAKLD